MLRSFEQGGTLDCGLSMRPYEPSRRVVVISSRFSSPTNPRASEPSNPHYHDSIRYRLSSAHSRGPRGYQQSESEFYGTRNHSSAYIHSRSEEPVSDPRFNIPESISSAASGFESPPESYRSSRSSYRSCSSHNDGSRRSHASSSTSRRPSPPHQAPRSNNSGSGREPHEREDAPRRQELRVVPYRHHERGDSGSDAGSDITSITIGPEDYNFSSLPEDSGRRDSWPAREDRFCERRRRGPNEGPPTRDRHRGVQENFGMGYTANERFTSASVGEKALIENAYKDGIYLQRNSIPSGFRAPKLDLVDSKDPWLENEMRVAYRWGRDDEKDATQQRSERRR